MKKIIIGNTWPLTLVRRPVKIEPLAVDAFKKYVQSKEVFSFWGHQNTILAASQLLGIDVTPHTERPVVTLIPEGLPTLNGHVFTRVYIVNPNYQGAYRPKIGEEIQPEMITGWMVLKVTYPRRVEEEQE